jgi:2-oxoglutarate dehydrogenase E1 component
VYYELIEHREKLKAENIAILRIEQFYPLSQEEFFAALKPYESCKDIVWVQDEPTNMGAWQFMKVQFGDSLLDRGIRLRRVSRIESASPSTGSARSHALEQQDLLDEAFAKSKP